MSIRPPFLPRLLRPQTLQNGPILRTRAIHLPGPAPIRRTGGGSVREVSSKSTRPQASQSQSQIIRPLRQQISRRFNSSKPNSNTSSSQQTESFSNRMRKLSREYGWAALGVYLAISALDFPICFAAVRLLGVERVGYMESVIVDSVRGVLPGNWGQKSETEGETEPGSEGMEAGDGGERQIVVAERRNRSEEASIWTQLALAYAIHKSFFIFIRVPLTAAVTPKVVKVLRRWGWDIGKRKPKGT